MNYSDVEMKLDMQLTLSMEEKHPEVGMRLCAARVFSERLWEWV